MTSAAVPLALPHVVNGQRHSGSALDWPAPCRQCPTRQCESAKGDEIQLCSYGFNYLRASDTTVLVGFIVKDSVLSNPARSKNFRKYPDWVVPTTQVERIAQTCAEARQQTTLELEAAKADVIRQYVNEEQYKTDFIARLKPEIQRGLSFVHDYKQINTQIAQNINVVLETRYPGGTLEEKLARATHSERAIYWASKFLQEKLSLARFLLQPEQIMRESDKNNFRFHGLVTKYVRIYQMMFDLKQLRVNVLGRSTANIFGNSEAISVLPHTFLDNALKYSPVGERIEVYVNDEDSGIEFSVSSYGPKLEIDEKELIFQAFKRGRNAEALGIEGAGYGLYVAQTVAKALHTAINVQQDTARRKEGRFWTTFAVRLPYT